MKKRSIISFLIPFLLVLAISALGFLAPILQDIDNKLYDAALKIKPFSEVSGKFLNVQVDDLALDKLKMYPLKRSTLADGMLVLKEFGADSILLDTQLVDPSVPGMNSTKFNEIPGVINQVKNNTLSYSTQLINAYANGQLPPGFEVAEELIADMSWEYDDIFDYLLDETDQIALDYDAYIANIFAFIDNIYVTNDFEEGKSISPEFTKYLEENQALKNIEFHEENPFESREGNNPAIQIVMESTKGSGFVETLLDIDGKTRRSQIILEKDGFYYPHLSFRSYLDKVGNPKINVYNNYIILEGVKNGNADLKNVKIPLFSDGSVVIDWAGEFYDTTFPSLNFYLLYRHDTLLKALTSTLNKIITNPNTNQLTGKSYRDVVSMFKMADDIKKTGDPEEFEEYRNLREEAINQSIILLNGSVDQPSVDVVYRNALNNFLAGQDFTEDENNVYIAVADEISKIFDNGRKNLETLLEFRTELKEKIDGTIITFGYTATSTFDIGSNPFEKDYFNMGIYPTLYNNLLAEEFITILPMWIPIVLAFIFAFIASVLIKKREANTAIILGLSLFLLIVVSYLALFYFTGIYMKILIPGLSFILVFIQKISGKLISTSKDKAFIKNAFGQYLSEEVIQDIINDPSKLQLGGEEKEITAFFTDVKGFSTISEKLTPNELVTLLNEYLTAMSNIALEYKGTIDKYEGDAIIGFFGAPAPLPDHATKAVMAAIRMKEMEEKLNKDFAERGMTPTPLQTRIGINSGPCVVGNMGTPKKMDYTMMGSDVNIAARLEGVNKQYGTWILASERTMDKAEDLFLTRRLDRVRVVGINNPIRLYNPICVKDEATTEQLGMVESFEAALTLFEDKQWVKAKETFKKALDFIPEDQTSIRYIQMCDKFLVKQPEDNWDGVFNLTSK
ncbi:MAG: CHASE2 domain-containing protein [Spirochaetaceae bacterium]